MKIVEPLAVEVAGSWLVRCSVTARPVPVLESETDETPPAPA